MGQFDSIRKKLNGNAQNITSNKKSKKSQFDGIRESISRANDPALDIGGSGFNPQMLKNNPKIKEKTQKGVSDTVNDVITGGLNLVHKVPLVGNAMDFVDRVGTTATNAFKTSMDEIGGRDPRKDPDIIKTKSTGNKIADKVADVGGEIGSFFISPAGPGASLGSVGIKVGNAAKNLLSPKLLANPKVAKILPKVIEGQVAGGTTSILNDALKGHSIKETAKNAAIGAALGGVADLGIAGLGKLAKGAIKSTVNESSLGLKSPKKTYLTPKGKETKALNEYYNDIDMQDYVNSNDPAYIKAENALRAKQGLKPLGEVNSKVVTKKERIPIKTTEKIEQPSVIIKKERIPVKPTKTPNGIKPLTTDTKQMVKALQSAGMNIDDVIEETKAKMSDLENKHYEYLKENNTGTSKNAMDKAVIRNDNGTVVKSYNVSQNPEWYSDFYAVYGRKPNNQDLKNMVQRHLEDGFQHFGDIPSNEEYLSLKKQLQELENIKAGKGSNLKPVKYLSDGTKQPSLSKLAPHEINSKEVFKGNKIFDIPVQDVKFNNQVVRETEYVTPTTKPIKPILKQSQITNNEAAATNDVIVKNQSNIQTSAKVTPNELTNIEDPLTNSDNWKDKAKFSYKNNTMERNFHDIMPKEDADKMVNTYIEPIKQNEANSIRELNEMRSSVKKFNIKAGSKESELAQKYGEGVITLDELKKSTTNWQKVKETAEYMRSTYDSLIDRANEVLKRNGYEPIPKRNNYMPHMGEVDTILKTLGIDNPELPTDINGLTGMFTPGKNWFGHALRRKGDQTVYDAVRGFDEYINGINKIIHHTDDIQRIRQLEKTIREKYGDGSTHLTNFVTELKDYGNLLAGKKSTIDRGFEETFGRNSYKVYDAIRKQLGANLIGGNISSALTNFIPLNQAIATTEKTSFIQGMMDTIANIVKKDGFVEKSDYLTRRLGSDKLALSNWEKVGHGANWLFKALDNFVGQSIVRGKYNELIKKGLSEAEALKQANNYAGSIMADRSLGMTPTLYNSKVLSPITQFQLEVNNQLQWLTKDLKRTSKSKAAYVSSIAQLAVANYVFNSIFEKATGRRPAFDPIGVAIQTYEDYNNPKLKGSDANKNLVQNVANQLPYLSSVTGGRIPLSSALPDFYGVASGTTSAKKELGKIPMLLLPTSGGQIKKTYEGLDTFSKGGAYNNGKLKFPVEKNVPNLVRSGLFGQYSTPEAKEYFKNTEKPLSEKQTKLYENAISKGENSNDIYNKLITNREILSIRSQIKGIAKDSNLSREQKEKEIQKLRNRLDQLMK